MQLHFRVFLSLCARECIKMTISKEKIQKFGTPTPSLTQRPKPISDHEPGCWHWSFHRQTVVQFVRTISVLFPEASISTRILGPDPTTSEDYRVHPIVDPTKFWEGVGDTHTRPIGHGDDDEKSSPLAVISQPKIPVHAPPRTPLALGELTALPQIC